MFRENVLVNSKIIERISTTMVPVALDYQKVQDRTSREAKFLLPLMAQRDQTQGVWIFSPRGKALGGHSGFGDMVGKMHRVLDEALKAFGSVEPREFKKVETHPYRGKGFRDDGGVTLAEYVRQREKGNIRTPVISSVELSAKEFAAFAPRRADAAEGKTWTLPQPVAKKLCRIASPMCYQHAPRPDWVKAVTINAKVTAVRNGVATITYEGAMSSHRVMPNGSILSEQELTLKGEGEYDIAAGKMRSLIILGDGVFRWPHEAPDKPVPFDALIEWAAQPSSADANQ